MQQIWTIFHPVMFSSIISSWVAIKLQRFLRLASGAYQVELLGNWGYTQMELPGEFRHMPQNI